MSLAPGTRLGAYEIVALIGAGGMGEVYRARDGKLTRDVAIKVLPLLFARDPERLARFTREANLLASLNHPNIAAIYGFESSDHSPALVLEMVEGPTLADRLEDGAIPLDEALPIARQIAEALEAAHAQGIVQRDLKPANIKVRDDGKVKVLDFGLAKAMVGESMPVVVGSPTITSPAATAVGTIMGTAAYMSPEQARGRAIDKRSDIWAFGAVLFEMLTGRRVFDGEDVSDTLANILKQEPDWSTLPPQTPPSIQRVLRRCLVKDPRQRLHDIADIRIEFDDREPNAVGASALRAGSGLTNVERAAWMTAALVLATLAGYGLIAHRPSDTSGPVFRFQIPPPAGHSFGALSGFGGGLGMISAVSPDGTFLVFYADDQAGNGGLWLRALNSDAARRLPDTDQAFQPFWSPDSRSVAFFAGQKLYRMDVMRGDRKEICTYAGNPRGGSWGAAGTIVYATGNPFSVMRVSAEGGKPEPIRLSDASDHLGPASWPFFLPDGRNFLYWVRTKTEGAAVHVAALGSETTGKRLASSETQGIYVAGYLLFAREGQLLRQHFDADSRELSGEAVPIIDRLRSNLSSAYGDFTASDTGVLAYRSGLDASNQFTWVSRKGAAGATVGPPGRYRTPALSPDGKWLAYADSTDGNLKLLDLQRGFVHVFTSEPGVEAAPVWAAGGTRVFYRSESGGVFMKEIKSTAAPVRIIEGFVNGPMQALDQSPLGPLLLYFGLFDGRPSMDIFIYPLTGKAAPKVIVSTTSADVEPQISPDGKWLAYASSETGSRELWIEPFPPDGTPKIRVSRAGGRQPMWRADSRELYFVSDDRKFYYVRIPESGPSPDIAPEFLFNMQANVSNTRNSYVPSADGQRFLVNQVLDSADDPINVISNWVTAIK